MTTEPRISGRDLTSVEPFAGMSPAELDAVAAAARARRLPAGTRVFNQGDENIRAHAVISGSVRISQSGSDGAQVVVRFIAAGEMFGTTAFFTDHCYPADATTLEETTEASWSEAALLNLMAQYPALAINVIRIIGKRLQEAQNRVRELATQSAERRIAHAVIRLAHQSGHETMDGTVISFPLRRKDVADVAGTTLYTASRVLTAWEAAGVLTSYRRQLTIRQPAEILRIAEAETG